MNLGAASARQAEITGQPFQLSVSGTIPNGTFVAENIANFDVPAGKRLLIETVSVELQMPVAEKVLLAGITTTVNGLPATFTLDVDALGTINVANIGPETHYSGTTLMRIYADGGTKVAFRAGRTASAGNQIVTFSVAGQLTNM